MTLTEIKDWLQAKEERARDEAVQFLDQHLPVLADLADKAAANPLVDAALNVVHVSPEILTGMASVLMKLDADLAALQPPAAEAPDPTP